MGFLFCGYYIDIDRDFKQEERDIYVVSYFYGFNNCSGFEDWKSHLEYLFCYILQNKRTIVLN